jgi:hypothetical protein
MKVLPLLVLVPIAAVIGCKPAEKPATPPASVATDGLDVPILEVNPGDAWKYRVQIEIPAGVTAPDAQAVTSTHERVRTYLGKVPISKDAEPVDCFEVTSPGSPADREFVNIQPDRIELVGELKMKGDDSRPIVFPAPIVFVKAGLQAGDTLEIPAMAIGEGHTPRQRSAAVIGREECDVPAGKFPTVRLVMGGMDGDIETRRTLWFSPGKGIVKEERVRYAAGKVVVKEIHELTEFVGK